MSKTTLVLMCGTVYSRFIGRTRTHKIDSDRPLTVGEVEELRRDPARLLADSAPDPVRA